MPAIHNAEQEGGHRIAGEGGARGARKGRVILPEIHLPMRIGHLEEGELDDAVLGAELQGVRVFVDRHILNEVPNVAVFLGRQPVVSADLVVTLGIGRVPKLNLGKTAI